jgi:hypothetical protein
MPFADKFRAMMDLPFPGDTVGAYLVESVDVGHESGGPGIYKYAVRLVLRGPGGQQGVKQALKRLFTTHCATFSGYGNSYQLWFGRPEIENLGDSRYAVIVEGAGARTFLEDDLQRFLTYLIDGSWLQTPPSPLAEKALVEAYLDQYRVEVKRLVDRYCSKLRKTRLTDRPAASSDLEPDSSADEGGKERSTTSDDLTARGEL